MRNIDTLHADHGLTAAHYEWLRDVLQDRTGFFLLPLEIPEDLPSLSCGLYGPSMGDAPVPEEAVSYQIRGNRRCASRLIDEPPRPGRYCIVIGTGGSGTGDITVWTAYGSLAPVVAPREPGDTSIDSWEGVEESRAFWGQHALSSQA